MKTTRIGSALFVIAVIGCKGSATPADAPPKDATSSSSGGNPSIETASTGAPATDTTTSGAATTETTSGGSATSTGAGAATLDRGVCEALGKRIGTKLDAIHDKNSTCKTAHDCEVISSGMCNLSVGCGLAVSLGKCAEVERLSEEATRDQCKTWRDGGCPTTLAVPIPTCPPMSPVCVNGRCSAVPVTR